jgi:hypothetical protein
VFNLFQVNFSVDVDLSINCVSGDLTYSADGFEVVECWGGKSFNGGLYRVVCPSDVSEWNFRVAAAFPEFVGAISCFGFDWLGRIFAVDYSRLEDGRPGVLMFDIGAGEALAIPCNVLTFHQSELIEYQDAALAREFYECWIRGGGASPAYNQCIGYKRPLFLGGLDEVGNLQTSDIDVYWRVIGEALSAIRGH